MREAARDVVPVKDAKDRPVFLRRHVDGALVAVDMATLATRYLGGEAKVVRRAGSLVTLAVEDHGTRQILARLTLGDYPPGAVVSYEGADGVWHGGFVETEKERVAREERVTRGIDRARWVGNQRIGDLDRRTWKRARKILYRGTVR